MRRWEAKQLSKSEVACIVAEGKVNKKRDKMNCINAMEQK